MQPAEEPRVDDAERLAALVARFEATIDAQAVAGAQLVAALRDQLADGQVETLLTLDRAGRGLRSAAGELETRLDERLSRLLVEIEPAVVRVGEAGATTSQHVEAAGVALREQADQMWVQMAALLARLGEEGEAAVERVHAQARAAQLAVPEAVALAGADLERRAEGIRRGLAAQVEHVAAAGSSSSGQVSDAARALQAKADQVWVQLAALVTRLNEEGDAVVVRVRAEADAAERRTTDAVQTAAERVRAESLAAAAAIGRAADEAAAALSAAQEGATSAVLTSGEALTTRFETAAAELSSSVGGAQENLVQLLRDAHSTWLVEATRSRSDLQGAGEHLIGSLREAAAAAVDQVSLAGDGLLRRLDDRSLRAHTEAEVFLGGLQDLLRQWEERDERRERRLDARVQRLVSRADESLTAAGAALAAQTDRLAERDANQEQLRADEFVRVLDDLLGRAGPRRDIRSRVLRVLERDRPAGGPAGSATPEEGAASKTAPAAAAEDSRGTDGEARPRRRRAPLKAVEEQPPAKTDAGTTAGKSPTRRAPARKAVPKKAPREPAPPRAAKKVQDTPQEDTS